MPHVSADSYEKGIFLLVRGERKTDSLSRGLGYHELAAVGAGFTPALFREGVKPSPTP